MQSLSEDEVRKRLEPLKVIAAIEAAFRDRYQSTIVPLRSKMELASGVFLIMPCYDFAGQALGMKLALVQNEPETAMDRVQATYMLLDPKTARPTLVWVYRYQGELGPVDETCNAPSSIPITGHRLTARRPPAA